MNSKFLITIVLAGTMVFLGCKSWSKTQKGAVVGTAGGGVIGAIVGKTLGNTALGAIVGATVGGVTGAVIGNKMDKQAKELEKNVPGATVTRVGEGIVVEFSEKILFGFDQSELSASAKGNLDKAITVLKTYPDTDIEVQGHTDSKGSEEYNNQLSMNRSTTVSNYLYYNGIELSRLKAIGYGESFPKNTNETAEDRAINRRVEFLITANAKMREEARIEAETK